MMKRMLCSIVLRKVKKKKRKVENKNMKSLHDIANNDYLLLFVLLA